MRNSKAKGFTLIELIVVIAIIGILAAILVPSMMGYMRNSRITRANANAKTVESAASSAFASAAASNNGAAPAGTDFDIQAANFVGTVCGGCAANAAHTTMGGYFACWNDLLGENFAGDARIFFNGAAMSVSRVVWVAAGDAAAMGVGAGNTLNDGNIQKTHARAGSLYGMAPVK